MRNKWSTAVRVDEAVSSRTPHELSEAEMVIVAELRAKAARYRLLVESLFDAGMVAVVLTCARELEAEAVSLEAGPAASVNS